MSQTALASNSLSLNFFVKIVQGPNRGDLYKISPPGVIIGRDPSASQITLFDSRVSRQQCRIDFTDQTITIEDLSGKSTTLVNEAAITNHELRHGDKITMGDTVMIFEVATAELKSASSRPRLRIENGTVTAASPAKKMDPKNMRILLILAVGAIAVIYLSMTPDKKAGAPSKVADSETVNAALESVQKRQQELEKSTANMSDQDIYNRRSAQRHYIRGFRDYQNGKYARAIEAFQTALATDPKHAQARRYYKLSEKKRQDLVDRHMDLGNKYREKSMYKLCIGEFEKVLQIINNPANKKYQLAKEQIKECRLSLQGRY